MESNIYGEYTPATTAVKEYMVDVSDGVKLRVIDFDPGAKKDSPVILFVAGWISLISGWKGLLQEITPKFRTIYLETREKSTSEVPTGKKVSYDMERLRIDILDVVNSLIPPGLPFVMAGSSLGATAIMEYCAAEGRKPQCAILIGPNAEFRFPRFLTPLIMAMHPSLYSIAKPLVKWYLRNFRLDKKKAVEQIKKYERTLDAADPYKLKANAIALKNYSIWDKLQAITLPCLIVGATTDKLHGTENIGRMLEKLPRASYIEMESNMATHGNDAGKMISDYLNRKKYLKQ